MTLQDYIFVAALILIFAPLEHLLPAGGRNLAPRRLATDALHVVIGGAIIRWGMAGVSVVLVYLLFHSGTPPWADAVRRQPDWLEYLELLVVSDLGFYAAHRLVHSVPWLWRFHEVHHSSEQLDCLATFRVHPVDQILNSTIIGLPALLLGFSPTALLIYGVVYQVHSVLLHSNVRVHFGPLRWLIASPHYHHWHHANQADAYDKNFGGQLVLFDWLFGTLNLPVERPAALGIQARMPPTFLGQMLHPFRKASPPATEEFA